MSKVVTKKLQTQTSGLTSILLQIPQEQDPVPEAMRRWQHLFPKECPLSFLLSAIVDLQKSVQRQWLLMQKDRECRGVRQVIRASGSRPSRAVPSGDSVNYYQGSIGVSSFFHIGLVPCELSAFEDYRWDLIGQGQGPETIVVHNSRGLSNFVASCMDPIERFRAQRLLRHLHGLLVIFQSRDPEQ